MKYKLTDQCGIVIASGDQLALSISVDIENQTMSVRSGAIVTNCGIAGGDKFTLQFTRETYAQQPEATK